MKYITMRYVAARRRSDGLEILFGTPDGDRWFVGGELRSDIRGEFHEQYNILKEYGEDVDNSGDVYDLFIQDYPPKPCPVTEFPKNLVVPLGWLAPDGRYFPCQDGAHIELASDLRVGFYGPDAHYGGYDYLEKRGWIHIGFGMVTFDFDRAKVSEVQVKALNAMREIGKTEGPYTRAIDNFLELAEVETEEEATQRKVKDLTGRTVCMQAGRVADLDLETQMRLPKGTAWYEHASYTKTGMVRLAKLVDAPNLKLRQINRYGVEPDTVLTVKLNEEAARIIVTFDVQLEF